MRRICFRSSGWKMIVSSMRLRNSGRKRVCERFLDRVAHFFFAAAFLGDFLNHLAADVAGHHDDGVVKSTVWPWLSVRRPSSSTCSRMLNTSRWAFSISSSSTTRVRAAADRFGELAPFFVADVARRGADQAADGVLFHEFAHVEADHGVLVVEQHFGEGLAQLGFAHAGRAEEDERADRAVRILQAAAAAADGVGDGLDRFVLADHALMQPVFEHEQLRPLGFEHAGDRDAGPGGNDLGDFVGGDFLAEEATAFGRFAVGWLRLPFSQPLMPQSFSPVPCALCRGLKSRW